MSIWGWASLWEGQQQTMEDKPNLSRWLEQMGTRDAVVRGRALHADKRGDFRQDKDAQSVLFKRD
jgi:GST-like protein